MLLCVINRLWFVFPSPRSGASPPSSASPFSSSSSSELAIDATVSRAPRRFSSSSAGWEDEPRIRSHAHGDVSAWVGAVTSSRGGWNTCHHIPADATDGDLAGEAAVWTQHHRIDTQRLIRGRLLLVTRGVALRFNLNNGVSDYDRCLVHTTLYGHAKTQKRHNANGCVLS